MSSGHQAPLRTTRRAAWALADQAVSSGTNFALTAFVAHETSAHAFGIFALAIALVVTAIAIARGLSNDPLASRFAARDSSAQRNAIRGAMSTSLCVGLLASASAACFLAFSAHAPWAPTYVTLAVIAPGVILQDTVRSAYLVTGRVRSAFVNDSSWALCLAIACAVMLAHGESDPAWYLLAWGLSGTACAVLGCGHLQILPQLTPSRRWLAQNTDLWPFYLTDNALFQVSNLLLLWVIAANSGLADVAGMRIVVTVFGPLVVLAQAVSLFAVPEMSRRGLTGIQLRRAALTLGASLGLVSLVAGICGYLLPTKAGAAVFGDTWHYAKPLMPFATVDTIGVMLVLGVVVGLRALSRARSLLLTRVVTLGLRFAGGSTGAFNGGALGAFTAIAALAPIFVLLWYRALWQATRASASGDMAPL